MELEQFLKKHFHPGSTRCMDESEWLRELLTYRAKEKDSELLNDLLRELVLKYAAAEKELVRLNKELVLKQSHLDDDLRAAAGIQQTLLPESLPAIASLEIAWKFLPCSLIGGDIFNVVILDEDHVGLYIIDVSGHGVPSALVTLSVSQSLHPDSGLLRRPTGNGGASYEIMSPRFVLNGLNEQYPLERFNMFFTIVYAVLNIRTGVLCYGKAGHPPPVVIHANGGLELLSTNNPVIGMGDLVPLDFEEEYKELVKGDRVLFYTDGIEEYENPHGRFYGKGRFHEVLHESRKQSMARTLDRVIDSMLEFGDHREPQDDVSLLGIEFHGSTERHGSVFNVSPT